MNDGIAKLAFKKRQRRGGCQNVLFAKLAIGVSTRLVTSSAVVLVVTSLILYLTDYGLVRVLGLFVMTRAYRLAYSICIESDAVESAFECDEIRYLLTPFGVAVARSYCRCVGAQRCAE